MAAVVSRSILFGIFLISLLGCEQPIQTRPFGIMRLGKVSDVLSGAEDGSRLWLKVLRDERGIRVVSTLCPHDLEPLSLTNEGYRCSHCGSTFSAEGARVTGPAISDLPAYKVRLSSGEYGGPVDSIFVHVGEEQDREIRFQISPAQLRVRRSAEP